MENNLQAVEDSRPVIFVTGFGPFPGHPTNASQSSVELLAEENIEEELGVRLVTEIVRVEYDYVKKIIPQRWKELKPKVCNACHCSCWFTITNCHTIILSSEFSLS